MPTSRKRKQQQQQQSCNNNDNESTDSEPFPSHRRPTHEECRYARDALLDFHGFPQEFVKYRTGNRAPPPNPNWVLESDDDLVETETVLDGLVSTLLSQNTTEVNARRAFVSLKSAFPNWEDVLAAELKCIESAIKCGGLAATKASCIKNLLTSLVKKKGKPCLEYLRDMTIDEVKQELCCFKGIGPKTVACVLMFHLHRDDFPVDTHVFRITKDLGWIPASSDRKKAYLHLNRRIPNDLKFDLNCLFVTHGKLCDRCTKKINSKRSKTSCTQPCPLSTCIPITDSDDLT
ncbi:hypothetical protein Scep_021543 [Stephania cephalantha]|uniref:HhH-GPD domain-containing protein n=1 Tax=Stephania cephalantha TaxID=152367 RepID=A0AAP0I1Y6_9MAGN